MCRPQGPPRNQPHSVARWHRGTLVSLEILEDVLLRKISWTQRDKNCVDSLPCRVSKTAGLTEAWNKEAGAWVGKVGKWGDAG